MDTLRRATINDASACALIVDSWIEKTVEMPRLFDKHQLTEMIKTEMDDQKRNSMIREAFKIHQDEFGHIPLHQQALAWGIRTKTVKSVIQRPFNDVDLRYVVMK